MSSPSSDACESTNLQRGFALSAITVGVGTFLAFPPVLRMFHKLMWSNVKPKRMTSEQIGKLPAEEQKVENCRNLYFDNVRAFDKSKESMWSYPDHLTFGFIMFVILLGFIILGFINSAVYEPIFNIGN